MDESRCVVCGETVGGAEAVLNDRGQVVAVRALPPGPRVCLWCLPAFLARGGRVAEVTSLMAEEVDGECECEALDARA